MDTLVLALEKFICFRELKQIMCNRQINDRIELRPANV